MPRTIRPDPNFGLGMDFLRGMPKWLQDDVISERRGLPQWIIDDLKDSLHPLPPDPDLYEEEDEDLF